MPRYYFDIRENDELAVDEEGLELPDNRHAEIEAAQSLADMAKSMPGGIDCHHMSIEVRTGAGALFRASLVYEATRH
jgi:hypothetical protein